MFVGLETESLGIVLGAALGPMMGGGVPATVGGVGWDVFRGLARGGIAPSVVVVAGGIIFVLVVFGSVLFGVAPAIVVVSGASSICRANIVAPTSGISPAVIGLISFVAIAIVGSFGGFLL